MSNGATVTAYVGAPLCAGAKRELAQEGGRAGDVRVRVVCLSSARRDRRLVLAAVGANARRAVEDSTTVAYLESPGKESRYARPIVESAEIPWIESSSGKTAMAQLLDAIRGADTGSLRESVRKALGS